MRTGLDVILGNSLTDQLFLSYGARIHQFDSGTANPCVTRASNFSTHLPIRNHHPLDFKITAISKLVDESVSDSCLDLNKLFLVSRSSVVAALVKSKLLPLFLLENPVVKLGADHQPVYGYSNPRHPTLGNKRKLLEDAPDADEIADEDDFQAAAFASSLAPSSSKKYTGAMRDFMQYMSRHSINIDYDLQKEELIAFLRKWIRRFLLSEGGVRGLSFSAINGKSYGIRWHFLINHEIDVLEGWLQHKVFMRGVKRLKHHPARKIPVSWSLLLLTINSLDLSSFRHLVIAAGLILGWYFGTRISELINFRLCSIVLYDAHGAVLSLLDPNLVELAVEVDLKFGITKADQHGEGAVRSHHCTHQVLCCVRALATMLVARVSAGAVMNPDAPLFLFFDGSDISVTDDRLNRAVVARTLKAGAAAAGIPAARVSCHSLRSGGATAMLRAGKSYEDVRCFYRWRSDVARIYLRSVRGAMHDVSALMASGAGMATVMLAGN
jgi:integrase